MTGELSSHPGEYLYAVLRKVERIYHGALFDPSLFVKFRKRVGRKVFESLNADLFQSTTGEKDNRHAKKINKDDGDEPNNKGKLQVDATVADQYISFPTDNGILNESHKKCGMLIVTLYELIDNLIVKFRTYRRTMDQAYPDRYLQLGRLP